MRVCHACGKEIPSIRLRAVPSAILCVPCLTALGDVLPLRRFDEHNKEDIVETLFVQNGEIDRQIRRERTHVIHGRVLAEITESDVIEPMAAEIRADERSTRTIASILNNQSEPEEEI